jgi:hypothetical protein
VAHQVDLVGSEVVAQLEDITGQMIDAVRLDRFGAGPGGVAPLVGGDAAKTGGPQRAELCPPLTGRLGKPVQQHDRPSLVRAAGQGAECPIPEVDLDLVHGGRRYSPG